MVAENSDLFSVFLSPFLPISSIERVLTRSQCIQQ